MSQPFFFVAEKRRRTPNYVCKVGAFFVGSSIDERSGKVRKFKVLIIRDL